MVRLGINIDHVATVRQARGEGFPDPLEAAQAAVKAGANGITAHLREDRRHIQDADIRRFVEKLKVPFNMEMSVAPEIVKIAEGVRPDWACLVPEKRRELTTEGGLDVQGQSAKIGPAIKRLQKKGIKVSLFVAPDKAAIEASSRLGADAVELHTGTYAQAFRNGGNALVNELRRIETAAELAASLGLVVNAGHGIDYDNVGRLLKVHPIHEFNIGFAIVARAMFVGISQAVKEMKGKLG